MDALTATTAPARAKPWGTARPVVWGDYMVEHCKAWAGHCCSKHTHARRWNRFYVVSGRLAVVVYPTGPDGAGLRTALGPGEFVDVAPGVLHRFEALETTELVEVYWCDGGTPDPDDIDRVDQGGMT